MSHWVEVIDPDTNEVIDELDEEDSCGGLSGYEGYCGGCGRCQIAQACHCGLTFRYALIGPVQE